MSAALVRFAFGCACRSFTQHCDPMRKISEWR